MAAVPDMHFCRSKLLAYHFSVHHNAEAQENLLGYDTEASQSEGCSTQPKNIMIRRMNTFLGSCVQRDREAASGSNSVASEQAPEPGEQHAQLAMDKLLRECFVEAANTCAGLKAPLKGTTLYVQFMRPCRPAGTSLDVKGSSFKFLRKFLESLEKDGLLRLDPDMQDPFVTEICSNHPEIRSATGADTSSCRAAEAGAKQKTRLSDLGLSSLRLGPGTSVRERIGLTSLTTAWKPSWALKSKSSKAGEEPGTPSTVLFSTTEADTPRSVAGSLCTADDMSSCNEPIDGKQSISTSDEDVTAASMTTDVAASVSSSAASTWAEGDCVARMAWSSDETWGDERALNVIAGNAVYVHEADDLGWVRGEVASGETGWLPAYALQRQVYMAKDAFLGGSGYATIEKGEALVVACREGSWLYGARIETSGRELSIAVNMADIIEQGWFPSSLVDSNCLVKPHAPLQD
jgi:hypothetical protein